MAIKLFPYKAGSASAKDLANALGIKRLKHEGSRWRPQEQDRIINWGCSTMEPVFRAHPNAGEQVLNHPEKVAVAINKLTAFQTWKDAALAQELTSYIPLFWTDKQEAITYLRGKADRKVVCRTNLRGYGGAGIVIAATPLELVAAPLYVAYIPKVEEYRVHVMNGVAFFTQRKARKLEVPDDQVNWQVRNLEGGFIYANQNVQAPDGVTGYAQVAVRDLGLDFGAVDIVVTGRGKVYVLEVNTACGLAGTTLDKYVEAFKQHYNV